MTCGRPVFCSFFPFLCSYLCSFLGILDLDLSIALAAASSRWACFGCVPRSLILLCRQIPPCRVTPIPKPRHPPATTIQLQLHQPRAGTRHQVCTPVALEATIKTQGPRPTTQTYSRTTLPVPSPHDWPSPPSISFAVHPPPSRVTRKPPSLKRSIYLITLLHSSSSTRYRIPTPIIPSLHSPLLQSLHPVFPLSSPPSSTRLLSHHRLTRANVNDTTATQNWGLSLAT
jgi:hypothetical protein